MYGILIMNNKMNLYSLLWIYEIGYQILINCNESQPNTRIK